MERNTRRENRFAIGRSRDETEDGKMGRYQTRARVNVRYRGVVRTSQKKNIFDSGKLFKE